MTTRFKHAKRGEGMVGQGNPPAPISPEIHHKPTTFMRIRLALRQLAIGPGGDECGVQIQRIFACAETSVQCGEICRSWRVAGTALVGAFLPATQCRRESECLGVARPCDEFCGEKHLPNVRDQTYDQAVKSATTQRPRIELSRSDDIVSHSNL